LTNARSDAHPNPWRISDGRSIGAERICVVALWHGKCAPHSMAQIQLRGRGNTEVVLVVARGAR